MSKQKTLKNKVAALGLVTGGLTLLILEGDATFLVFAGLLGTPLFLSKENHF